MNSLDIDNVTATEPCSFWCQQGRVDVLSVVCWLIQCLNQPWKVWHFPTAEFLGCDDDERLHFVILLEFTALYSKD